jgi:hypothetical protein
MINFANQAELGGAHFGDVVVAHIAANAWIYPMIIPVTTLL